MSKYIKLEDAIKAIAEEYAHQANWDYPTDCIADSYLEEARDILCDLPTIEVSEDCIGDCNVCRFAGCSECDDCINGSQWVRMTREDEE